MCVCVCLCIDIRVGTVSNIYGLCLYVYVCIVCVSLCMLFVHAYLRIMCMYACYKCVLVCVLRPGSISNKNFW